MFNLFGAICVTSGWFDVLLYAALTLIGALLITWARARRAEEQLAALRAAPCPRCGRERAIAAQGRVYDIGKG